MRYIVLLINEALLKMWSFHSQRHISSHIAKMLNAKKYLIYVAYQLQWTCINVQQICGGLFWLYILVTIDGILSWYVTILDISVSDNFTQMFVHIQWIAQANTEQNSKVPQYWHIMWETTSNLHIPLTKGHWCGNDFKVMMSSCSGIYR